MSLRALVEAVDAACEKQWGPEYGPVVGDSRRWPDGRAKAVNRLSSMVPTEDEPCDVCGSNEHHTRLICTVCDLTDRLPEEETDSVPLGGLSHDDAHRLLSGIGAAADVLDAGRSWPDDARLVARYLRELLK